MEEIFEKIKESASKAKDYAKKFGKSTVDKTNTVVSQTKLRFAIGKTEDKIKEIYTEIGGLVYDSYADETAAPDVSGQCEKLDSLYKELADLKQQLSEISDNIKCSKCGTYNKADNAYCCKCGEKLDADAEAADTFEEAVEEVVETVNPED